jgi:hypothetical protein
LFKDSCAELSFEERYDQLCKRYGSVEEFEEVAERYFRQAEDSGKPITLSGLSVALDWSRRVIIEFDDKSSPFYRAIKKARRRIREYAENYLYTGKNQVAGIFALKCNWGWQDTQKIEYSGAGGGPLLLISRPPARQIEEHIADGEIINGGDDDPLAL